MNEKNEMNENINEEAVTLPEGEAVKEEYWSG